MEKIEDRPVNNRQLIQALVKDLVDQFGYAGYKVADSLSEIQRKEGRVDVIKYMQRKYLQ